jgi:hypothetical protein
MKSFRAAAGFIGHSLVAAGYDVAGHIYAERIGGQHLIAEVRGTSRGPDLTGAADTTVHTAAHP